VEANVATTLNASSHEEVVVISVEGPLALGSSAVGISGAQDNAANAFRLVVSDQLAKGAKKIVVDLLECSGLDSSGIGSLVISYTKTANGGGQLVLVVAPKTKVMDVLQMTKIFSVFKVFDSVASAIQGLTESKTA
jgi:anti-sigma B factor antagonist